MENIELDADTMVKGCKVCSFIVTEEQTTNFWNFCPTCGTQLTIDKAIEYSGVSND